jgi:hypothetical protein
MLRADRTKILIGDLTPMTSGTTAHVSIHLSPSPIKKNARRKRDPKKPEIHNHKCIVILRVRLKEA